MTQSMDQTTTANELLNPTLCDIEILVDKSGSMGNPIGFGSNPGMSRDSYMEEWVTPGVAICARLDSDGIGVGFFNHTFKWQDGLTDVSAFSNYYRSTDPMGGTNLGAALETRLNSWLQRKSADPNTKPLRVLIFTDGEASDKDRLINAIRSTVNEMTSRGLGDEQVGIMFVQVGNDSEATTFLTNLDDNLGLSMDIVDRKPLEWLENHSFQDLIQAAEQG